MIKELLNIAYMPSDYQIWGGDERTIKEIVADAKPSELREYVGSLWIRIEKLEMYNRRSFWYKLFHSESNV